MRTKQYLGVRVLIAALAVVVFGATAAFADTVYNTLDNTIDATHESMNLTFPGSAGSTTLQIQVQDHPDHQGCNIQGDAHYIGLSASSSNAGIVGISWLNGDDTFNTCDETLTVIVTPLAVGSTTVSFAIDSSKTNNDPALGFSLVEATFDVVVADGSNGGGGNVCDADPAAPAWAAAILQKNGFKPKATSFSNYVSQVAHHMTNGAMFEGNYKNEHPDYENSVHDWMVSALGLNLPYSAAQSARPGWVCTPVA
jgi:hypothetical protein